MSRVVSLACLLLLPTVGLSEQPDPVASTGGARISFERQIAPIFRSHCNGCHQPAAARGEYVMTRFESLLAAGESGEPAIVPGDADASYLIDQITTGADGHAEMPKEADPLTAAEVELVRRWIDQGAENDGGEDGPTYTAANPPRYSRLPLVTSIDFHPNNRFLAVAGYHEVLLLSGDGAELQRRLVGLSERIETVAFSPDGSRLATAGGRPGREGEIQIWDPETGTLLRSISVGGDTVYGASWSPDGTRVAVGCPDNVVRAFDVATGEQTLFMGSHNDWPLDTEWSVDGSQLVSIGRDMTAKLTEVATERFIDNVTSITPGALKGGIHSVVRHPHRDEILVGGSDGQPKIYRLKRLTKRVIGDDAQLMRKLPSQPGRVFGVAWDRTGHRVAAVSALDGRGHLNVSRVRYDSNLPAAIKAINEKRVFSWTDADRKALDAYYSDGVTPLWSVELPTGQYAVAFSPDSARVAIAGGDGLVRLYLADTGTPIATIAPVETTSEGEAMQLEAVNDPRPDHLSIPREQLPSAELVSIEVQPRAISLGDRFETSQMLVTGYYADGTQADLTRLAEFDLQAASSLIEILPGGLVRPLADGEATVAVAVAGESTTLPVAVAGQDRSEVSYSRHVNPVVSKAGCNQGTCHGAKDGKEGFKLSLRGYDPLYDLRALTDDLKSRRVNLAQPDDSLMLLKASGRVPHVGGAVCEPGTDAYATLRAWIAAGARLDPAPVRVTAIELQPRNPVLGLPGSYQQMRVVATYDDGSRRDVTADAFLSSGNTDVADCDSTGLVSTARRGEAPILARFEGSYAATTVTVMGDRDGFEWVEPTSWGPIDDLVASKWERMKIAPSGLCDDATFIRRASLDLTGLPPTAADVRTFVADPRPPRTKRADLVDRLLESPEYTDFWTNKWADLLMVNRKFLGPEGAKLYRGWIREHVAANTPYDEFVRQIVTASGSNKENPAASYWKVLRDPTEAMENTTHLFLATRFNCNKCHDHPFERWTQDQYYQTAAYFAQVERTGDAKNSNNQTIGKTAVEKGTPLFEVIADADSGEMTHDRTGAVTAPQFPYEAETAGDPLAGRTAEDGPLSRREELALWITAPDNRYFASSYANRIWGYLLGVGLIEPLDDIRAGNPPSNPELLRHLEREFIDSGFDVRHLMRQICTSRTYGLDVATNRWNDDDATNYSHAYPKRLPAEVLYDAIHFALGAQSSIPGMPAGTRALQLPDAGVKLSDGFLANLGRPVRESSCECERSSGMQLGSVMALVSGPTIESAISDAGNDLPQLVQRTESNEELVAELFLRILNRPATAEEIERGTALFERLETDDQTVQQELADFREQVRMAELSRKLVRDQNIRRATRAVADYEASIAERERRLDREQADRVATLSSELDTLRQSLAARVDPFVAGRDPADEPVTEWVPIRFDQLRETVAKNTLTQQDDLSVVASGRLDQRAIYQLDVRLPPGEAITGLKIEALADGAFPGNGPGRGNGNFVLTELDLKAAPGEGGRFGKIAIAAAAADFAQKGYPAKAVFDGDRNERKNGWAVSPQQGRDHTLTVQLKQPLTRGEDGRKLQVQIDQRYPDRKHVLGRFRVWYTTGPKPLEVGLPQAVAAAVRAADRTPEQTAAIVDYLARMDKPTLGKLLALQQAEQPRPTDPKLVALRQQLSKASQPLRPNPTLVRLERASRLSAEQMASVRLTAAQDLAWALMNSPAFLFNH